MTCKIIVGGITTFYLVNKFFNAVVFIFSCASMQVIPLHLPPGDPATERTLQINGTPEAIEAAKLMVNEVISEVCLFMQQYQITGHGCVYYKFIWNVRILFFCVVLIVEGVGSSICICINIMVFCES